MLSPPLTNALEDGSCLIETSKQKESTDLKSVLLHRLRKYAERVPMEKIHSLTEDATVEHLQFLTANESMGVVVRIQDVLLQEEQAAVLPGADAPTPIIGARDLAQIRTHLSLVFNWAFNPIQSRLASLWPKARNISGVPPYNLQIYDDFSTLHALTTQVLSLVFPTGLNGSISRTLITAILIDRHIADILRPAIFLGWLPKRSEPQSLAASSTIRQLSMRLLAQLPPAQTIASLGLILSSSTLVPYAKKSCSSLLSQQLLRPDGVLGLCTAVFGEGDVQVDDKALSKYEQVARVLSTPPSTISPEEYFPTVIPRLLALLSEHHPLLYRRAAAFTVSRIFISAPPTERNKFATQAILDGLHEPLISTTSSLDPSRIKPATALARLAILMANIDPSPQVITSLLSPVVPSLYSLHLHLEKIKTSDPAQKETVHTLIITWGKTTGKEEVLETLQAIIMGQGGYWETNISDGIVRTERPDESMSLAFLTPNEVLKIDTDTNILDLYPDPKHFVTILKELARDEITSDLFVDLLERYRKERTRQGSDLLKTLLCLQIIMQMQTQMSGGSTGPSLLYKSTHMLHFVKHVLETAGEGGSDIANPSQSPEYHGPESLKLREDPKDNEADALEEYDSDDDMPNALLINPNDDLFETALNLLLSVLEANEDLSARTEPVLADIFSLLDDVARSGSKQVQSQAKEAKLIMTAQLASGTKLGKGHQGDSAREIYQKALKLIQDPILPVRAHGLMMLKNLVIPPPGQPSKLDPAFVPAILSVFLQSIQDNDSYIFLNAVQGLAAMIDKFGKEIFTSIIRQYSEGLDGLSTVLLTPQDLDIKVRIGEALALAIQRTGTTLGLYVDLIVPVLMKIMRSQDVPTTLRTSSISLLGDCEKTHPLAMLPYLTELAPAMVDLLQVEGTTSNYSENKEQSASSMDDAPTSTNSKFPPLRRSALHFLQLLIRETTRMMYDSVCDPNILPAGFISRARTTLNYISSTDRDGIVRIMAREASESLEQLFRATFGLED
ncbi:hypothetical protein AX16_003191 [Volvariella volvacea WC 439]|nr:hypothetical protein AX16_003191 [Volvariella volvacea WC 439]